MLKTTLGRFRIVAIAEGISYILLLGVAMPFKYMLDMPMGVRILGRIHGGLFVVYVLALISVMLVQRWSIVKTLVAFVASMIPLGAFLFDLQIKYEVPADAKDE